MYMDSLVFCTGGTAARGMTCDVPTDCRCPATQVHNSCGSACTAVCGYRYPICTQLCVDRCECPLHARFRNSSNMCVSNYECPGKQHPRGGIHERTTYIPVDHCCVKRHHVSCRTHARVPVYELP